MGQLELSLKRTSELLKVSRSTVCYKAEEESKENQRLMRLRGITPAPRTTVTKRTNHKNLSKHFHVTKPNQVWCAGITYIRAIE